MYLSLLIGCAGSIPKERLLTLEDAVQAYASSLRWQHYESLGTLMRPQTGQPKLISWDALDNIRITSYKVRDRRVMPDTSEAEVAVEFNYYHTDVGVVQTLTDQQTWWYEEESKRWLLDEALPNFAQAPSPSKKKR